MSIRLSVLGLRDSRTSRSSPTGDAEIMGEIEENTGDAEIIGEIEENTGDAEIISEVDE